ncbi:hypothetical protein [Sutcliffiella rhizosphaerae]|uniref:Uncharacterized protein n=1 Tax=Sutcliffiella rhizosphaerae TaxID=2880967 RepID=A0ABM8YPI9_9BACI|nr:hypothetical protein [Sutcliffiella rhizosphaerae]CAG9621686.1 hypothetical protein BACCIP111883_02459 [Sutcliffiella rhizosphaerae]
MIYTSKYPTVIHSFILSFMLIQGMYQLLQTNYGRAIVQLTIACLIIFSYLITYRLKLNDLTLIFEIAFIGVVFYHKSLHASNIRKIEFKRLAARSSRVYIYTMHFLPKRVINYKPEEIYENLLEFARVNQIPIMRKENIYENDSTLTKEN